jgi:broad-specificity NMP kinase
MPTRYLITGVAGTGKSSVAGELTKRGLAAYDADAGFSHYAAKSSGEKVIRPLEPTLEWYADHERVFDERILKNLFKKHTSEPLFICSITANQKRFYPDFNKIFLLQAPDELVEERLNTRTNSHFGKQAFDRQRVIAGHKAFDHELLAAGAVPIDSTRPITEVVDAILEQAK